MANKCTSFLADNINSSGVDTEMTSEAFQHDEITLDAFGKSHPIGRMGTPNEIAGVAAFLFPTEH